MVAEAVLSAANRSGHGAGIWFVFVAVGGLIGLTGISLLVKALKEDRGP